jgi:septal ring factor EnvC (AmiA/AmiB activator)
MILTVAAVALLALGCGDSDRLESELTAANTRIATLDSALANAQQDLKDAVVHAENLKESLAATRSERDDLAEYLKSERQHVNRLDGELQAVRARYATSMDSLAAEKFALQIDLDRWKAEVEHSSMVNLAAERKIIAVEQARDSLSEFVEAVRPWYDYYSHEAGRGWPAKLFGADKADAPGTAEPVLVSGGDETVLEVQR